MAQGITRPIEAIAVWSRVETTYGQPFDAYLRYYFADAALAQGDIDTAGAHLERVQLL
jgi:hypothetical protein